MPMGWAAAAAAVVGAVGAIAAGQAQQQQMEYQATVQQQQANYERQVAASNEQDYRRKSDRLMASRRAIMGASGVEAGEGSPLLVSQDLTGESELQALKIRNGGAVSAGRLEQQAVLSRFSGEQAKTGSYFRAGGSLLQAGGYSYGASTGKFPSGGYSGANAIE